MSCRNCAVCNCTVDENEEVVCDEPSCPNTDPFVNTSVKPLNFKRKPFGFGDFEPDPIPHEGDEDYYDADFPVDLDEDRH